MRPSKSVVIISRLGKFDTRLVLRAAVWYSIDCTSKPCVHVN